MWKNLPFFALLICFSTILSGVKGQNFSTILSGVQGQKKVKFLVLVEENAQMDLKAKLGDGLAKAQSSNAGFTFEMTPFNVNWDDEDASYQAACQVAEAEGFSAILDLTWGGWDEIKMQAEKSGMPYVRLEGANHQFVKAADDYLHDREAIDAALIVKTKQEWDQTLFYLNGNSYIRAIVVNLEKSDAMDKLAMMRPSPSYYVAHGTQSTIRDIYNRAKQRSLVNRDARWTFVFHDWRAENFPVSQLDAQVVFMTMSEEDCCVVKNEPEGSSCSCGGMNPAQTFVEIGGHLLAQTFANLDAAGKPTVSTSFTCQGESEDKSLANDFKAEMMTVIGGSRYHYIEDKMLLTYPLMMDVVSKDSTMSMTMGTWGTKAGFKKAGGYEPSEVPRFFRIGTVPTTPWASYELDARGMVMKDDNGAPKLKGYCIEMIEEMAKRMNFDYEISLPSDNSEDYGQLMPDGSWSGVIGDLVKGEIDIAVAGMTMTSEREEVVDFVAPYFEQSGISIILREPVRPRSLFKFMEVLRYEVWTAILAAIIVTAVMMWFFDRFSPYSARNNKEAHPYPCRVFTLKESIWFALNSFTPQGGGEAPKSLSGRLLTAAYWLFVVLMVATFAANLAAFLTVERMETTVAGLEELAQQSKINYTVVEGSSYYEYFQNMASAEKNLYEKWKDMTLSSDADQSRYRVWDYPIKELYGSVFETIKASGMVRSASEGFQRVMDDEQATFAFIHDSSQIRYEYYNNCNFTEIGEPFAEQPYAVAVQQGSHLQEEISKTILMLQKARYFEMLSSKYWNSTMRSSCPILDDSEGITIGSLEGFVPTEVVNHSEEGEGIGGVFITTMVGLVIAMIILAFEVYFHKKEQKNNVRDISGKDLGGQFNTNYGNNAGGNGNSDNKTTMQVGGRILTVSSKAMDGNKSQYGNQFD